MDAQIGVLSRLTTSVTQKKKSTTSRGYHKVTPCEVKGGAAGTEATVFFGFVGHSGPPPTPRRGKTKGPESERVHDTACAV